jgi:hypothetical protein
VIAEADAATVKRLASLAGFLCPLEAFEPHRHAARPLLKTQPDQRIVLLYERAYHRCKGSRSRAASGARMNELFFAIVGRSLGMLSFSRMHHVRSKETPPTL